MTEALEVHASPAGGLATEHQSVQTSGTISCDVNRIRFFSIVSRPETSAAPAGR